MEQPKPETFSFDDFASADTASMSVVVGGKISNWKWVFAGPGHPQTVAQSDRIARDRLHEERKLEEQRRNGRKVKIPEETPEDIRRRNVDNVVERLVGWSPVVVEGADYPFTPENARKLLSNPAYDFFTQALEFLGAENSFTRRSA